MAVLHHSRKLVRFVRFVVSLLVCLLVVALAQVATRVGKLEPSISAATIREFMFLSEMKLD
jgi:hypothetical protein